MTSTERIVNNVLSVSYVCWCACSHSTAVGIHAPSTTSPGKMGSCHNSRLKTQRFKENCTISNSASPLCRYAFPIKKQIQSYKRKWFAELRRILNIPRAARTCWLLQLGLNVVLWPCLHQPSSGSQCGSRQPTAVPALAHSGRAQHCSEDAPEAIRCFLPIQIHLPAIPTGEFISRLYFFNNCMKKSGLYFSGQRIKHKLNSDWFL